MLRRLLSFSVMVGASSALASGFYMGDNGAQNVLQGGAFAGQADDLSAMQHNPAGLAQLDGFNVLLDGLLAVHNVTFQRYDQDWDPASPPRALANPVSNTGGPFLVPMVGVSYGHTFAGINRTLTIGLGAWGPPSVGRYQFPVPNYTKDDLGVYVERPNKFAPQRYGLINNDILIVYPTLTASFEVVPRKFFVGGSLQVAVSKFYFRQAVTSQLTTAPAQGGEQPEWDSVVTIDGTGRPVVTGILGLLVKPIDSLGIGASVRPPISINARGTLGIELGEQPTAVGATVTGNQADLAITMPLEIRAGVNFRPIKRLGLSADFVYQGWNALQEIVLTPDEVTLSLAGRTSKVAPFHIKKNWQATWSVRGGASFDIIRYLSVSAGVWYETSAAAPEYVSIDFVHPSRLFVTGGIAVHLGPVDIVGGVAISPAVTQNVTKSEVRAGSTDESVQGSIIGNGQYTSSSIIGTLGLRAHFGGPKQKAREEAKWAPKPTPQPELPIETPPAPAAPAPTVTP